MSLVSKGADGSKKLVAAARLVGFAPPSLWDSVCGQTTNRLRAACSAAGRLSKRVPRDHKKCKKNHEMPG